MSEDVSIRCLNIVGDHEIQGLSDVLVDCVEAGASVSFMFPMTRAKAETFWTTVSASAARGERVVLIAEGEDTGLIGTVQIVWAQPENQAHRADVAKMLVHRRARRRGVGGKLLAKAEHAALRAGKTLLTLDTVTDTDAYRMYARHGWHCVGEIPNYALWPGGKPCPTTVFFKSLTEQVVVAGD